MSLFSERTSAEVAEEAENERADLVNTLERLRQNLRPENVVDEVMAHANFDSSALMDRVWQTARANPIPAALIGLGAAMLLGFGRVSRSGVVVKEPMLTSTERDRPPTSQVTVADRPQSRIADPVGVKPDSSPFGAESAGVQERNTSGRSTAELIRRRNDYLRAGHNSTLADPRRQSARSIMNTSPYLKKPGSTLSKLFNEQPLVLAAIGVAVGAAVGAALPPTEVEGQLMGDASEAVRQNAAAAARQQLSQLKATADQTFDQIKSTVAEHGVSNENLSGLVHQIGEQVKAATYSATQQAADSLPRHS